MTSKCEPADFAIPNHSAVSVLHIYINQTTIPQRFESVENIGSAVFWEISANRAPVNWLNDYRTIFKLFDLMQFFNAQKNITDAIRI